MWTETLPVYKVSKKRSNIIYLQVQICIFSLDIVQCVQRNSGGGVHSLSKGAHHKGAQLGKKKN